MKYKLKRLNAHKLALAIAITSALLTLLSAPMVLFLLAARPQGRVPAAFEILIYFSPVISFAASYLGARIFLWMFMLVSGKLGGVDVELEEG